MTLDHIIASIDAELSKLKQVRSILSGSLVKKAASPIRKRRKMSAAARKRIAEAQRKRWAKQKANK